MKPIDFPEANVVYGEGQEGAIPLPACREDGPRGQAISCWELSDEEIEMIQKTRTVYISQLTFNNPLQPIYAAVDRDELFL